MDMMIKPESSHPVREVEDILRLLRGSTDSLRLLAMGQFTLREKQDEWFRFLVNVIEGINRRKTEDECIKFVLDTISGSHLLEIHVHSV